MSRKKKSSRAWSRTWTHQWDLDRLQRILEIADTLLSYQPHVSVADIREMYKSAITNKKTQTEPSIHQLNNLGVYVTVLAKWGYLRRVIPPSSRVQEQDRYCHYLFRRTSYTSMGVRDGIDLPLGVDIGA